MADIELTTQEAARELSVTPRTVRRYLGQGKLHGRKVSVENRKEWAIDAESVRALSARKQPDAQTDDKHLLTDSTLLIAELRALRQEVAGLRVELSRRLPPGEPIGTVVPVEQCSDDKPQPKPPPRWKFWKRGK